MKTYLYVSRKNMLNIFIISRQWPYLSPGVNVQDLLRLMLHFLKLEQFLVISLQLLLLQSDHYPPAGRRAGAPQQSHVLGHGFTVNCFSCKQLTLEMLVEVKSEAGM